MNVADAQVSQILCLEHRQSRLYVELIQAVTARQVYWVRPFLLLMRVEGEIQEWDSTRVSDDFPDCLIYDVRQCSDLLWPMHLFRVALDVEIIPLLMQVVATESPNEGDRQIARQRLHQFIHTVWQSNLESSNCVSPVSNDDGS